MLNDLTDRIARARASSPLAAARVTLIAVSKGQPRARVEAALAAGILDFGENRVQEAEVKFNGLDAARLHLIGGLQRNKARAAVALFDAIHTIDRPELAEELAAEMARQGRRPECFVQVNTGEEPQKGGVMPPHADGLIAQCRALGLPLVGLMCVPPADAPPAPHFALLRQMGLRNGLAQLSMGMSADFETAIRFGATHVRIGTALFGARSA